MAVGTVDPVALLDAVRAVMLTVELIGTVETEYGGSEPWIEAEPEPGENFWELSFQGARPGAMGQEEVVVELEGWSPHNREWETTPLWLRLLQALRDAADQYPTLACQVEGLHNSGSLQLLENRVGPYSDRVADRKCHYARLEWTFRRSYTYTTAGALP
jgi:hypothetical protein